MWKPLMTEREADKYTASSFYRNMDFYHGTTHKGADSITTNGVDISKNKLGIYAQGFYLTNDEEIAVGYADLDNPAYVKVKILVKNPKIFQDDREAQEFFSSYKIVLSNDRQKTDLLKSLGYDAIEVKALNYFVVFDREQVATFEVEKL